MPGWHRHRPRDEDVGTIVAGRAVQQTQAPLLDDADGPGLAAGKRIEPVGVPLVHLARTVHLTLAIGTSLGTLFPLVTGLLRWREQGSLRQHRVAVYTWLVGVVATLGTGIWMLTVAERTAQSLAGR